MKILYLGAVTNRDMIEKLSGGSVAGNKMQLNLLENLVQYSDVKIDILSNLSIAAFPKDKKVYVKKDNIELSDGLSATQIPFINFPIIKQVWQTISIYNEAKAILSKDKDYIIFTFCLFPQQGLPLLLLKKRYGCKVVSLLADLPIDEDYGRKGVSKILRKIFDKLTRVAILACDNLIVLNKEVINQYAPNANYIVIDGGIDLKEYEINVYTKKSRTKNIVYSGALFEYNGIINLINAMNFVKDDTIELHIYGNGLLEQYVREKAKELPNVKYFGKISNEEMRKKQRDAWLLINPRSVDDPISKVTFPSKIFEYMLSGTPVLTTKLNGFTEDYFDKMFFMENNEIETIAKHIDEIALMPDVKLMKIANKSRDFVIANKSWKKQTKLIYEFIKRV